MSQILINNVTNASRPLVIIVGWLGCKPKSLKRYISIYKTFGCNVLTRIPSPSMVVHAASRKGGFKRISFNEAATVRTMTMNDLAIETIEDIRKSNCTEFFIHVFSNAGCFLWEGICEMLSNDTNINNAGMKMYLKGVVYDSAPADFSGERSDLIFHALQYCSPSERLLLKFQLFYERVLIGKNECSKQSQQRAIDFWLNMKESPLLSVRSLYIFSKTDALTPFHKLKELVNYRQETIGKDRVQCLIYDDSRHCSHLLSNAQLYKNTIQDFLQRCRCDKSTDSQIMRDNDSPLLCSRL